MGISEFYLYQALWYVFAAVTSFFAGLFFWNKGLSAAEGKLSELGLITWKLSGAAAIFVVVLLMLHLINPLKSLSDYKKILVVYETAVPNIDKNKSRVYVLKPDVIKDPAIQLNSDEVAIEMIPYEFIFSLSPEPDGNTFATTAKGGIPPGTYKIRFIQKVTGTSKEFALEVP
jgi:hypothetical protein